jgi:hypothetical protein
VKCVGFDRVYFHTILDGICGIWCIPGCHQGGMLVLLECIADVPRHRVVHIASIVVPREFDATEEQACPVNGNLLVFLECRFEVMTVLYVCYFDAKVVNNKAKGDGPLHVTPQSGRCLLALIIPLGREAFFQQIVCQNASLGETVHPLPDLNVDTSASLGNVTQVIGKYYFFWDDVKA